MRLPRVRFTARLIPSLLCAVTSLTLSTVHAQDAEKAGRSTEPDEPELVITPRTIRVQPTDPDEKGHWIEMPGYGELGSPCFSRDARRVAFDAYKMGYNNSRPECWVARSDGTELKKLVDGATPRWSPDGKRLLFIRGGENDAENEPDVYVIDQDGANVRKIGPGRWPDWSPDGKRIAYSRGGLPGGGVKIGATIFVSDADGTHPEEVIEGDAPSWSPDGLRIAFCFRAEGRPPLIRVIDLQTKKDKTVGVGWFRANWMPDGKAVTANGPVQFSTIGMVKLSVEGAKPPSQLFSQFDNPSSPCPSSDGEFMSFIAKRPAKLRQQIALVWPLPLVAHPASKPRADRNGDFADVLQGREGRPQEAARAIRGGHAPCPVEAALGCRQASSGHSRAIRFAHLLNPQHDALGRYRRGPRKAFGRAGPATETATE